MNPFFDTESDDDAPARLPSYGSGVAAVAQGGLGYQHEAELEELDQRNFLQHSLIHTHDGVIPLRNCM